MANEQYHKKSLSYHELHLHIHGIYPLYLVDILNCTCSWDVGVCSSVLSSIIVSWTKPGSKTIEIPINANNTCGNIKIFSSKIKSRTVFPPANSTSSKNFVFSVSKSTLLWDHKTHTLVMFILSKKITTNNLSVQFYFLRPLKPYFSWTSPNTKMALN